MTWKCAVCGVDRSVANERRTKRRLRPVRADTPCCSPECFREYDRQRLRSRYGKGTGYRYPIPARWRCKVCGRRADDALHEERERRGLPPLTRLYMACSPECAARLDAGLYANREKWCCSECGKTFREADHERIRRGLEPLPAAAVTCSSACERARLKRLGAGWHCSECGAGRDEAVARGARITTRSTTCSRECSRRRAQRRAKGFLRIRAARLLSNRVAQ